MKGFDVFCSFLSRPTPCPCLPPTCTSFPYSRPTRCTLRFLPAPPRLLPTTLLPTPPSGIRRCTPTPSTLQLQHLCQLSMTKPQSQSRAKSVNPLTQPVTPSPNHHPTRSPAPHCHGNSTRSPFPTTLASPMYIPRQIHIIQFPNRFLRATVQVKHLDSQCTLQVCTRIPPPHWDISLQLPMRSCW